MSKTIVIDPGHGGHDPGGTGNGLKEKDLVLDIGLKLGVKLKAQGFNVIYTRTTDVFISLARRAQIANEANADIFISIHVNAGGGVTANGVEIFSYPGSKTGMELSKTLLNQILSDKIFKVNRGNKTANFAVLRLTKMPAVLTETGFVDHSGDARILRTRLADIANSLYQGVLNYFGVEPYYYRVRRSWDEPESQKGAYEELKSAIQLAQDLGLKVYDEQGKQVYPEADTEHWAEEHFQNLKEKGFEFTDRRFDDYPTRGEMFAFGDKITGKKKL